MELQQLSPFPAIDSQGEFIGRLCFRGFPFHLGRTVELLLAPTRRNDAPP
jgi:hypothetical protein